MKIVSDESPQSAAVRYRAAVHAMQSGVATKMNYDPSETTPKHLRVGVNSAMVEHSALAHLLIDKGVITEQEYLSAIADGMERERDMYVAEIQDHFGSDGPKITLG
jgi:hypothetical protein